MSILVNKLHLSRIPHTEGIESHDKQQLYLWKPLKYDIFLFC